MANGADVEVAAESLIRECKFISKKHYEKLVEVLSDYCHELFATHEQDEAQEESNMVANMARDYETSMMLEQETASLDELPTYLEQLYEGVESQLVATRKILALVYDPSNLDFLAANHEPTFAALSRILREDAKKNMELSTNIVAIFFHFSQFSEWHEFITNYKVGDMTLKLIDYELKRVDVRISELERKKEGGGKDPRDAVEEEKRFNEMLRKQDRLLYVCFSVLLNLAEDQKIEKKMHKRKIVEYLITNLSRRHADLILLVITFLKRLSVNPNLRKEMLDHGLIERLLKPLKNAGSPELLLNAILRLLVNLSFDFGARQEMVRCGYIVLCVEFLRSVALRMPVLKILYHISADEKHRSLFSYTPCMSILRTMILETPENRDCNLELIALCINLTLSHRNSLMLCENSAQFDALMARVTVTRDPLLMKVMRNLSGSSKGTEDASLKMMFLNWMDELVAMCLESAQGHTDLLVECLGTLGNLTLPSLDFAKLLTTYQLTEFIYRLLLPSMAEDDVALECVIFIGTIASDEGIGSLLASSRIIHALVDLLIEKMDDDDFALQLLFTLSQLIQLKETREILLHGTQLVFYVSNLLANPLPDIRQLTELILDWAVEYEPSYFEQIRKQKFMIHNAEWCEALAQEEEGPQDMESYGDGYDVDSESYLAFTYGSAALDQDSPYHNVRVWNN